MARIVVPCVAAALGIYLIYDHFTSPRKHFVAFKTASSELRADLDADGASGHVFDFINHLFQLKELSEKEKVSSDAFSRADRFAPR